MDFKGKVVVIYGAASDVGRACSKDLARHGATLLLIDESEEELQNMSAELAAISSPPRIFTVRIGEWEDVRDVAGTCATISNAVHLLITCPMAVEVVTVESCAPEGWQKVVSQNLLGPIFAVKAFLPLLKAAAGASIIHVGSIDGVLGNPQVPSYSVSKGGIVPLTHVMASEFAPFGIRVNCAARAMAREAGSPYNPLMDPLFPHTPLGRAAYPREIATVVRFLASDDASYLSGVVLPIDGGRSAVTPGTRPVKQSSYRAPKP